MVRSWQSAGASTPVLTRSWGGSPSADWSAPLKKHRCPNNPQHGPVSPGLVLSALTLVSLTSSAIFFLFAVIKDPFVHKLVIHDGVFLFFFLELLFYFACPAAPRR